MLLNGLGLRKTPTFALEGCTVASTPLVLTKVHAPVCVLARRLGVGRGQGSADFGGQVDLELGPWGGGLGCTYTEEIRKR